MLLMFTVTHTLSVVDTHELQINEAHFADSVWVIFQRAWFTILASFNTVLHQILFKNFQQFLIVLRL